MSVIPATDTAATHEETSPGYWTVTLGDEQRTITQTAPGSFIAWIGFQSQHWCFARAFKACVEDIEYRLAEAAMAQQAHEEAIASLMSMTPAQKARLIGKLEEERDALDYADSPVNVVAKKAVLDRRIARLSAGDFKATSNGGAMHR